MVLISIDYADKTQEKIDELNKELMCFERCPFEKICKEDNQYGLFLAEVKD